MIAGLYAPTLADTYEWTLTGPLGDIPLHAEATFANDVWTYHYTATISASVAANISKFSVGNPDRLPWIGPWSPGAPPNTAWNNKNFTDPSFTGTDSVLWVNGNVPRPNTIEFGFQSLYRPTPVRATISGGIRTSDGWTLGMTPEPATLMSMACGMMGIGAFCWRRRARR